ncbi:hypothetical protein CJD_A0348 [Clostridium perfringens D str. JGS1721]|uniref:Uncharacterized protein n=1 Tax=Clostridium perfringens D str. JGS1721 TaxID=488537 RepID=B1V6T5_CLOPF|nr:hypothetical protein [Clostridium perfringens]EDT70483.1 hypothetical protein CJD_A0348 [Clostridium perfringens D str. JGS1721]
MCSNLKKKIYRIDDLSSNNIEDNNDKCLLIETDKNLGDLLDLMIAIKLRFNELIDYKLLNGIDRLEFILEVLEKFFKVKNVKEKYKYVLQGNASEYKGEYINNYIFKYEVDNIEVIQIDLYNSFKCNCINRYKEVIEIYLKNEDIDKLILSFKEKLNKERLNSSRTFVNKTKVSTGDIFISDKDKIENSAIENFDKALVELLSSSRKENLNVTFNICKNAEKHYYEIFITSEK